jgi:hypothetical protein
MSVLDCHRMPPEPPIGAVLADATALSHNNTYGLLPLYYVDRPFNCRNCGVAEVWTAKQQKWWYETAKRSIDSAAVRCRTCRAVERRRVEAARQASAEGLKRKMNAKSAE